MEGSFKLRTAIVDASFGVDVFMGPCSGKTHSLSWMLGFGLVVAESSYTAPNTGMAFEQLHGIRNQILRLIKAVRSSVTISPECFEKLLHERSFTDAEVLRIIEEAEVCRDYAHSDYLEAIQYLYLNDSGLSFTESVLWTLNRIADALEYLNAKRASIATTFCGVSWCKRLWFLLHGSHPPKSECSVLTRKAFGNA